jgi:hypothetical protein
MKKASPLLMNKMSHSHPMPVEEEEEEGPAHLIRIPQVGNPSHAMLLIPHISTS